MRISKLIHGSVLIALMAASPGCGTFGMDETSPPQEDQKLEITVQVAPADRPVEVKSLKDRIVRFENKYPQVRVTTDDWQYNPDQIGIKLATNKIATEFNTYATEGQILLNRKWMSDMTNLLRGWQHVDELNPTLMKPFTVNGEYNAVPQYGYLMTVTLNKKLFREKGVPLPPLDWTWDDMLEAAQKVSDPARGVAGFVPMTKGNEAGWNWVGLLFAAGGDVEAVGDGRVRAVFDSEAGLEALRLYKELKDNQAMPQNWVLGYQDALNLFALGKGAMLMAGGGDVVDYAIIQGKLGPDDLAVYPVPSLEKGGRHTGVLGGNYHVISPFATAEQREWAFKFLTDEYFTDQALEALEQEIADKKTLGQTYVPKLMNYWKPGSEFDRKVQSILGKHENVYRFDNELLKLVDGKEEPPYEAQACYAEITNMLQDVLTSKTADLEGRLKQAAHTLQVKVLDHVEVNR